MLFRSHGLGERQVAGVSSGASDDIANLARARLAEAKGKQDWDKRETERRREADREARAAVNASKHRMGR